VPTVLSNGIQGQSAHLYSCQEDAVPLVALVDHPHEFPLVCDRVNRYTHRVRR
jgi:alpha/beta superfamily hydrolase